MPPLSSVSVLIVSWNGRDQLAECLPALLAERANGVGREVLVLDNGSVDGTADLLRERHPEVRVIRSPLNLGFAAGNNRLAEAATGDALWLLNNDARPRAGCLEALVESYRTAPEDVAAVAGRLLDWEGARLDFGRGLLLFDGHALAIDQGRPVAAAAVPAPGEELLFGCGANLLVRRSSFLEAGGFDDRYFAYFEDVDLGWRLWAGGERVVAAPEAVAHHRQSASSSRLGNRHRGALFERNAFWTMTKNLEGALREKLLPCILMTYLSRIDAMVAEETPALDRVLADSTSGPGTTEAPAARGLARLGRAARRALGGAPAARPEEIRLELAGDRILAQLGGLRGLIGGIDDLESERGRLERRRRRSDLEIFGRFPLGIVPTYPGDERWFSSAAFAAWLPRELKFRRARLDEVISLGERG